MGTENEKENSKIKKTLRFSFLEGAFASVMIGFTQEYLTPFLLLLGGTTRHVGILNAMPNLLASAIQLKSADMVERLKSRKKVILTFVSLQALMLLLMSAKSLSGTINVAVFITMATLFTAFGALVAPAWGSLMSDLVSEKRGAYFGWRNKYLGFIAVASTFTAGLILHETKGINPFWGFGIIFIFACLFRMTSWYYLKQMHEPEFRHEKEDYFSFMDFISSVRRSNYARFVLYISLLFFSVNVASPFFAVLMIRDLHFSYLLYTLITITATLTVYITIRRWGIHADKVGNMKIIRLTSKLTALIPVLWVFNRHPVYLFFVQVFSGFVWAGLNLSASNFIYDTCSPQKRARCIAYYNAFTGFALCLGALAGGFLARYLPPIFGYKILTLFLLSSFLRFSVAFLMPFKLKEVRPVEKITSNDLLMSMTGVKLLYGFLRKTLK